jgi:hypothetical protein
MKTISLPDALADALTAALGGSNAAPVSTVDYSVVWNPPHIIMHKGVQIQARAPINPDWQPSSTDTIFGTPPSFVADPSNAKGTQACRSPAGFPLFWSSDGVNAYISQGEAAYPNDAAVLAAINKTTLTPDQIAANAAQWAATTNNLKNQNVQQGQQV